MSDQRGTTRQIREGVTSGISEEMNCHSRDVCGKYGHSLELHSLVDGKLVCNYCQAVHDVEVFPKHLHLVMEGHQAKHTVAVTDKDGKIQHMEVPKENAYLCPHCKQEFPKEHTESCNQNPHVNCHLWSKW